MGDLAKRHFGFVEDERMQVHSEDPLVQCTVYNFSSSLHLSLYDQ